MFTQKSCKKAALASLKGNWKSPVLANLVYILLTMVVMIPYASMVMFIAFKSNNGSDLESPAVIIGIFMGMLLFVIFIMIFQICINPALIMGYKRLHVKIANNAGPVKVSELFSGFKMYGKSMGVFWWNYLWIFLWTLSIYIPVMMLSSITTGIAVAGDADPFKSSVVIGLIICILLLVIAVIGMYVLIIYKAISYSFMWYVVCDDSKIGAIESMNISKAITKKHVGSIFLLGLSFIGWFLLGMLTLGIGLLWVIPYFEVTIYNAYKVLRNDYYEGIKEEPKEIVNKIEPVDGSNE